MNYHVVRLLSRIASEAASTAVYMLLDRHRRSNYRHRGRGSYKKGKGHIPGKTPYYASDTKTKRPYVPKDKPHDSLIDQVKKKERIKARTKKLNGKK